MLVFGQSIHIILKRQTMNSKINLDPKILGEKLINKLIEYFPKDFDWSRLHVDNKTTLCIFKSQEEQPRMSKTGKKGKTASAADSKLTFTPEGGFASTSTGAPGDKPAECKQN